MAPAVELAAVPSGAVSLAQVLLQLAAVRWALVLELVAVRWALVVLQLAAVPPSVAQRVVARPPRRCRQPRRRRPRPAPVGGSRAVASRMQRATGMLCRETRGVDKFT